MDHPKIPLGYHHQIHPHQHLSSGVMVQLYLIVMGLKKTNHLFSCFSFCSSSFSSFPRSMLVLSYLKIMVQVELLNSIQHYFVVELN